MTGSCNSFALDQQKPAIVSAKGEINNRSANSPYAADERTVVVAWGDIRVLSVLAPPDTPVSGESKSKLAKHLLWFRWVVSAL